MQRKTPAKKRQLASIVSKTRGDTKISQRKAYTPLPKPTRATEERMREEEKQTEDGTPKIEKNHVERRNSGRAVNERDVQGTGIEKKGELRPTAKELDAVGSMTLLVTFLTHLDTSKVPSRRITRSTTRRTDGSIAMVCEGTSADLICKRIQLTSCKLSWRILMGLLPPFCSLRGRSKINS